MSNYSSEPKKRDSDNLSEQQFSNIENVFDRKLIIINKNAEIKKN